MTENPFDQPYLNSTAESADSEHPIQSPPRALLDPASADLAIETATPPPPPRRVQWPAELNAHVSVEMASPVSPRSHNLDSLEGKDALTRALEEYSSNPEEPIPDRFLATTAPSSEGNSTNASSDGDHEERMTEMRNDMNIFVDPGETDGLPSVGKRGPEAKNTRAAWNLVRAYTGTSKGFMRQRKNAGFKSGQGDNANDTEDEEEMKEKEKEQPTNARVGAFFKSAVRDRNENLGSAPEQMGFASGTTQGAGGVLSALMALQQQQQSQQQNASGATSAATTPSSSRATSVRGGDSSDEDDEDNERMKFTLKQREKRATKNSWHGATTAMAGAGKTVAGGVVGGAGAVLGGGGRVVMGTANVTGAVLGGVGRGVVGGAAGLVGGAGHALGFGSSRPANNRRTTASDPASPNPPGSPPLVGKGSPLTAFIASRSTAPAPVLSPPSSPGLFAPRAKKGIIGGTVQGLKKLGDAFGIEIETSRTRPEAARSAAGVFGGLMLSTTNLAGVAAPVSTRLAPSASRPGYHLSRYSAPVLSTRKTRSADNSRRGSGEFTAPPSFHRNASASNSIKSHLGTPTAQESQSSTPLILASSILNSPALDGKGDAPFFGPPIRPRPVSVMSVGGLPLPGKFGFHAKPGSGENSPRQAHLGEYFMGHKETQEQRESREWEKEKKRRKKVKDKRKQDEVFITLHVAAILARQDFIMKMARCFMMFGAPSHRLEAQMQATARVLEINCQVVYIPGVMLMSFGDTATHTSEIKFLKQANGLDLGKLLAAYYVYHKVIYDQISVTDASNELDDLMVSPQKYKLWQKVIIGGLASAFIQPSAFYGSFIDCLVSIPLGGLLVLVQVAVSKNDLYSSLFEIVIAFTNAFLAAALASTGEFCFAAVASGSVVLILPGYIVLCGSLELANRSIISGSVRLVYSILYSLFLGFGLAMGSEVYQRITRLPISGATDYTCATLRVGAPWYKAVIPPYFYFLTIPCFLLMLGLRNGQPLWRKETIIMLAFGSAGFTGNYFSSKAFVNRADISSAIGSFIVGFLGNLYGKFTKGSPFVVMVVGVLLQLPSGLSNGGLLQFASDNSGNSTLNASPTASTYSAGFTVAESLIEVAIGLTVGLFVSAAIVNSLGGGRRRGSNLSSF